MAIFGVTRFLSEQSDETRPVPTTAFKDKITLTFGSMEAHVQSDIGTRRRVICCHRARCHTWA